MTISMILACILLKIHGAHFGVSALLSNAELVLPECTFLGILERWNFF